MIRSTIAVSLMAVLLAVALSAEAVTIPARAEQYRGYLKRLAFQTTGRADASLLGAQVHAESFWRPEAVSPVGACGLAQIMPLTEDFLRSRHRAKLGSGTCASPRWALHAMVLYMHDLRSRMAGIDDIERAAFALSGYHGGAKWVARRKALSPEPLVCLFKTCDINPGILPANQLADQEYARRILLRLAPIYRAAGW